MLILLYKTIYVVIIKILYCKSFNIIVDTCSSIWRCMHCSDQKNYSSNSLEHAIKLYVHVPERNNYNAQGK